MPPDTDPAEADALHRVAELTIAGDYGYGKVFTSDPALAEEWDATVEGDWELTLNGATQSTEYFEKEGPDHDVAGLYRGARADWGLTGLGLDEDRIDGLAGYALLEFSADFDSGDAVVMVTPDGRDVELTFMGNVGSVLLFWGLVAAPSSSSEPVAVTQPTLDCDEPVAAGTSTICRVTGGDPESEILWRATSDGDLVATAGVRLGPDGTGTFTLAVPSGVGPGPLDVELVEWNAEDDVMVTPPVPVRVPAGEGPVGTASTVRWPALALSLAGAAALASRHARPGRTGALD